MAMRVTIGERLGVTFRQPARGTSPPAAKPISDEAVPVWVEPERVICLAHAPSAPTIAVPTVGDWDDEEDTDVDVGPPRVTGHMEWLHKSVPVLVIHGRGEISPEEYAAGRRR